MRWTEKQLAEHEKLRGIPPSPALKHAERRPAPSLIFPTMAQKQTAIRLPDGTLKLPFMLCLPMPPRELWPNGRTHWRVKMRIVEEYKRECFMTARGTCGKLTPINNELIVDLRFVFTPRHRQSDDDNLKASVKATLDSLSGFVWVDDQQVTIGTAVQVIESVPGLHEWVELTIKEVDL